MRQWCCGRALWWPSPWGCQVSLVLVVGGRVRRGSLSVACGVCDGCGRPACWVLTSPKLKLTTLVCQECVDAGGPPKPPVALGQEWLTEASVRSALALRGSLPDSVRLLAAAAKFERDLKRWVKLTTPHGIRHVERKPKHDKALWCPGFTQF